MKEHVKLIFYVGLKSYFCVVDLTLGKFGPHPGDSCGGQGGLLFYVGVKGRQWFGVPDKQQKVENHEWYDCIEIAVKRR